MLARSGFAVPLDRSEVRSSPSGNPDNKNSQLPVIRGANEVHSATRSNRDTKHSLTVISMASFLIEIALSTRGQLGREQQ